MVRELERTRQEYQFPETAPAANPVFFRTYSRRTDKGRETWEEVCDRTVRGLAELGHLTPDQSDLLYRMQIQLKALTSGRWLWVGGSDWIKQPENFSGAYNCSSTNITDWRAFGLLMDLAMMGCGTGAVLEPQYINQLPPIRNHLLVASQGEIGSTPAPLRRQETEVKIEGENVFIYVGDSRQGWVKSYQTLLELSTDERFDRAVNVFIDLSDVRPAGEPLKGFGGVANPIKLQELYQRCAAILNKANGRVLTSVECCLLIDEAAVTIVAGNIRRCLPEDALVHTATGLVPIKEVKVGDLVQTPLGFRRVVDKFDRGLQDVYELETNATLPRATLNHRMAVLADAKGQIAWKRVSELVAGDRLLHSTQVLPGSVTTLPAAFTETTIALTADIAWLIGYTHGNGSVTLESDRDGQPSGRVEWTTPSPNLTHTTRLQQKLNRTLAPFGLTATHWIGSDEKTIQSVCASLDLAEYFDRYLQASDRALSVPSFILQGEVEIRAAYLAGLVDSQGGGDCQPCYLLTTVYPTFARQVSAVFSSLGIAGRLTIARPDGDNWQVKYNLTLPTGTTQYNTLIAPHSAIGELRSNLKKDAFTIPGAFLQETYAYREPHDRGGQGFRPVDVSYDRYLAESGLNLDIPVTFKGTGSYNYVQTYDIEVEEAHCFYCDGYLVHNSAGMRQGDSNDTLFAGAKENLWQQDENGNWRIDPQRDALRMANHTRVFHSKPTLTECIEAVRKQYYSGEGAIQWAGEAVARANSDLLNAPELKVEFLQAYEQNQAKDWLKKHHPQMAETELDHRLARIGLNPCGEIIGSNFHCNLAEIHLNQIDPYNFKEQEEAFTAGALSVAVLLNHRFMEPRYQYSRELDPIVGVSFTGLFDFFVHAFGVDWLRWWSEGRPETPQGVAFKQREQEYLTGWRNIVHQVVWDYCDRQGLKRPNRCTTVQPSGTKSLLTSASPGWHPPKAQRFIRRITFRKNDPVALACIDYGYSVIPSQSDKDEKGNLLDDPFDSRCSEWLVEIPVAVPWADLPGADTIEIGQFSALAQMDFYMQVQKFYVRHNTSATIELREHEVEALGNRIYEAIRNDEGYISAALLARFDDHQTFPRLPFEPIDKQTYDQLMQGVLSRRKTDQFYAALMRYDLGEMPEAGPSGCDSDKCLFPEQSNPSQ